MGLSRLDWALSKKVWAGVGCTVLMLLKARPRSPSPAPEAKEDETWLASSITWPLTEVPPTVTSSVPQVPLAPDPSAYWMLQVEPDWAW